MFYAFTFVLMRISQICTLIPIMGMLAWFVNRFVARNALTPDSILILFITSVLALAWAVFTLFSYHRSSANARFVAFVDLAIFATLIAAVYALRAIADADCGPASAPSARWYARLAVAVPDPALASPPDKPCAMLKTCWAFAIMNTIFFFITAVAAFNHGDHLSARYNDPGHHDRRYRSRHSSDHRHRHHHHHRSRSGHSSRRSSHSHSRRVYV